MKPNFDAMSVAELRAYVLIHRQDTEAFYQLADRLETLRDSQLYPAPDTPEAIALMEAAIREQVTRLNENREDRATD